MTPTPAPTNLTPPRLADKIAALLRAVLQSPGATDPATPGATNEVAKVTHLCRAVSLAYVTPNADPTIAYAMQNELRASTNLFDPKETKLGEQINPDQNQDTNTFTFNVTLALKRPIKL